MSLIKTIVVKSSLNCNLRCNYCYEFNRRNVDFNKHISSSQLDNIIKRIATLFPNSHILWMLHGGEPFVNGIDYFERFCESLKYANSNMNVDFKTAIQTNATLLNAEWISVIEKYSDLLSERILSISIDGPKHINDLSRVNPKGESTFQKMLDVFDLLKKSDLKYTTISVVGSHNKDEWKSTYDFIKHIAPSFSKFIPCYNINEKGYVEKLGITPMDYAWFMTNMFDLWIEDSDNDLLIDPFLTIIRKLSNKDSMWCEYRNDKCEHFVSIYPNGDLWLCDTYDQESMKKYANLGNIFQQTDEELHRVLCEPTSICGYDALYNNVISKCKNCNIYEFCSGGCIPMRYGLSQKSNTLYEEYCKGRRYLIEHIKKAISQTLI